MKKKVIIITPFCKSIHLVKIHRIRVRKIKESRVVRVFDERCQVSSSTVVGVKSEEYRRQDSALRAASGSMFCGRESRLKTHNLRSFCEKADDPLNESDINIIGQKLTNNEVGLNCIECRGEVYEQDADKGTRFF